MKLIEYLKDKVFSLMIFLLSFLSMGFFLIFFNINKLLIISILFFYALSCLICFLHEYYKKKYFYDYINKKLNELDKKYLITELIKDPEFLEGTILKDYLYEIDKSYIEEINKYKLSNEEFKEYIELWCHEVKTPIATSKLILANNKEKVDDELKEELNKVESFVEQILFYARSGNPEKDYLVTKVNLKNIIENVIIRNKKYLINKKIKIKNFKEDALVYSDSKWIEFIVNQIIINSVKYSKEKKALINIDFKKNANNVMLFIEDNGIGIPEGETAKVFDKGFTGSNGRKKYNSTGIGLYLCKKLCDKLGHNIIISSIEGEFTKVTIIFPNNSLIEDIK
jgi:signal transduction histidine kinase